MRSTPRSLGLHGTALSAGLIALLALSAFPGCTSSSDSDAGDASATTESVTDTAESDKVLGDGEESLDADGYLGDSTSSGARADEDHGGDDTGEDH
ncbi:MAG TPA: hypothetical protein VGB53_15645 [Rubricoccaceae bacterium]|jgi:hypothetical protein